MTSFGKVRIEKKKKETFNKHSTFQANVANHFNVLPRKK